MAKCIGQNSDEIRLETCFPSQYKNQTAHCWQQSEQLMCTAYSLPKTDSFKHDLL